MISSGELPDIISAGWMGDSLYSGGLDKFVDDNVLIRVNELVDQYAPDYKSAIENVVEKEEQKEFYTDSGNISMPSRPMRSGRTTAFCSARTGWTSWGWGSRRPLRIMKIFSLPFRNKKGQNLP